MRLVDLGLFCEAKEQSATSRKAIRDANPALQAVFKLCVAFLRMRLEDNTKVIITSVVRTDGIHATGRAVDFVVGDESGTIMRTDPKIRAALSELKSLVELLHPYGVGNDGRFHFAVYWETDDRHGDHVHLQVM